MAAQFPPLRAAVLVALLSFLLGCQGVRSLKPVGSPLSPEQLQPLESKHVLDGAWLMTSSDQKEVLHVKYLEGGRLILAAVRFDDGHFHLDEVDGLLTSVDDRIILNTRGKPASGHSQEPWNFYWLAPVSNEHWILIPPNGQIFADAVRQNELSGEIETKTTLMPTSRRSARAAASQPAASQPAGTVPLPVPFMAELQTTYDTVTLKSDPKQIEAFIKKHDIRKCFLAGDIGAFFSRRSPARAMNDMVFLRFWVSRACFTLAKPIQSPNEVANALVR